MKSNEFSGKHWLQNCKDEIAEIFDLGPKMKKNLLYAFLFLKQNTVCISFFFFFFSFYLFIYFFLSGIVFIHLRGTAYTTSSMTSFENKQNAYIHYLLEVKNKVYTPHIQEQSKSHYEP